MVQASFLPKYYAGQGLISWRKILSLVATQGLGGGYKTLATRVLLLQRIVIAQFPRVDGGTETLFLLKSYTVQ